MDLIREEYEGVKLIIDYKALKWETDILKTENRKIAFRKVIENANNIIKIKKDIKKTNVGNNFTNVLKQMEEARNTPAIKNGFNRFDEALGGGLRGGRLYAIGAR